MMREPDRRTSLLTLGALLCLALWLVWKMIAPYLDALFVAVVLGVSGLPLYDAFQRRWRRSWLSALITTSIIVALIAGPMLLLIATVAREAQLLYTTLEAASQAQGGWSIWLTNVAARPLEWMAQATGMTTPNLEAAITSRLQDMGNALVERVGNWFGNVATTLVNASITIFTLYFFFQSASRLREMLIDWIPLPAKRVEQLLVVCEETILANVYGTLAVAVAQGAFLGIGFALVRLPSPWLWSVVGMFAALIPVVGTAIVWVPAAIALVAMGSWLRAIILAVWCIVMVATVCDNVLRPYILRGRMPMNTLLIILSIMGGLEYFGLVGIIAGPVVFSITATLFRFLDAMIDENGAPTDDPAFALADLPSSSSSTSDPHPLPEDR